MTESGANPRNKWRNSTCYIGKRGDHPEQVENPHLPCRKAGRIPGTSGETPLAVTESGANPRNKRRNSTCYIGKRGDHPEQVENPHLPCRKAGRIPGTSGETPLAVTESGANPRYKWRKSTCCVGKRGESPGTSGETPLAISESGATTPNTWRNSTCDIGKRGVQPEKVEKLH